MILSTRISRLAAALALSGLLTACGGGGGDDSTGAATPGEAQGAYAGTLTGSTSSIFRMLVLEDDQVWAIYGNQAGNTFQIRGFMQGQGASSNGTFTAANVIDYGDVPPAAGAVNATYTASNVNGTVAGAAGSISFAGTKLPANEFAYDTPASLAGVAGAWTLGVLDGSVAAVTIAANGSLTGNAGGCNFTGSLTPRASGKNVFDVTVTFGGAPCAMPGVTGTGIGLHYPTTGGAQHQLLIAGVIGDRSSGTVMAGVR